MYDYEIGDRVKIKENLIENNGYEGWFFTYEMKNYPVITISGARILGDTVLYSVEENNFVYTCSMLGEILSPLTKNDVFNDLYKLLNC